MSTKSSLEVYAAAMEGLVGQLNAFRIIHKNFKNEDFALPRTDIDAISALENELRYQLATECYVT